MADLTLGITAKDGASDIFMKVGKAALKMGADAVGAFIEAEKADAKLSSALKQLGYDSERLTQTFKVQAGAFQDTLGVSEEMVQSMQSLMLRYGTAPRDIQRTTSALLDYAAATGQDAESATMQLLKAVEGGGKSLSRLGIDIEETGDKSKDLAAAVDALGEKFGGAAAANAETLGGKLQILKARAGEFEESLGGLLATIESRYRVVDTLTEALRGLESALGGGEAGKQAAFAKREGEIQEKQLRLAALHTEMRKAQQIASNERLLGHEAEARAATATAARRLEDIATLNEEIAKLKERRVLIGNQEAGIATEGQSASAAANNVAANARKSSMKAAEAKVKAETEAAEFVAASTSKLFLQRVEQEEENGKALVKAAVETSRDVAASEVSELKASLKASMAEAKIEQEYAQAGAAIGVALVGALSNEIQKLKAGGEFDLANILKAALPIVGGIIGSSFGPAGTALGGALGGLAGSIFHDGGYVGELPRHHSGSWIGADERAAILQTGERVVSRAEIAGLGGPRGAERAIRGGGTSVYISALDPRSFQEYLGDEGGGGFARTLRQGRGELAQIFRRRK